MNDHKIPTKLNHLLEQAGAEPLEPQTQPSQASAAVQSERPKAPGRIPLFRR